MTERGVILRKLKGYSREFVLLTEKWTLEDWKEIRDEEYYEMMSLYGIKSQEFCEFKLKKILNKL